MNLVAHFWENKKFKEINWLPAKDTNSLIYDSKLDNVYKLFAYIEN
jgi:hypothetical protein